MPCVRHHDPAGFRYPKWRQRLMLQMGVGHICVRFYPMDVRGEQRATLLMLTAMQGNEDIALLLCRGAHSDWRDQTGKTALDDADECHQTAVAALLQRWQKLHPGKYPLSPRPPHLPGIVQKILGITNQ